MIPPRCFALLATGCLLALLAPSTAAEGGCDASQRSLAAEVRASPLRLTEGVARALAAALAACAPPGDLDEPLRANLDHPNKADAKGQLKKGVDDASPPCVGQVAGLGPLTVVIVAPLLPPVVYQDLATIVYDRDASGHENMTATDPALTGFEAWVNGAEKLDGEVRLAGVPLGADSWSVAGACIGPLGSPCHAIGSAHRGTTDLYVEMEAELNRCGV